MRGALGVAAAAVSARGVLSRRAPYNAAALPGRVRATSVARFSLRPDDADGRRVRKKSAQIPTPSVETWGDEPPSRDARGYGVWDDSVDEWDTNARNRRGTTSYDGAPDEEEEETTRDSSGDVRNGDYDDAPKNSSREDFGAQKQNRDAGFASALPGAAGGCVAWVMKAIALVSDATANGLSGIFPKAVPKATLKTLSYFLWALAFFAVFQKLLSTLTLVGGLALLAVSVASGETSRSSGSNRGGAGFDNRKGNRGGKNRIEWGTRSESFDAFNDFAGKTKRDDFFRGAEKQTRRMREFWTEDLSPGRGYSRQGYDGDPRERYPGDVMDGDEQTRPFRGDGVNYGNAGGGASFSGRGATGGEGRKFREDEKKGDDASEDKLGSDDFSGEEGFVIPGSQQDWSYAATEAAAAAAATAATAVRFAQNFAIGNPAEQSVIKKNQSSPFDGVPEAASAGFAFDESGMGKQSGKSMNEPEAVEPVLVDPVPVVEPVSFDDWVGRDRESKSKSEAGKKTERFGDDSSENEPASFSKREARNSRETPFQPPFKETRFDTGYDTGYDDGRFDSYRSRDTRMEAGYDRWANTTRSALNGFSEIANDVFGTDDEDENRGSQKTRTGGGGNTRNRFREFLTGKFGGTFQSDLVPVRFRDGDGDGSYESYPQTVSEWTDDFGDVARRRKPKPEKEKSKSKPEFEVKDRRFVDGAWVTEGSVDTDDDVTDPPKVTTTR